MKIKTQTLIGPALRYAVALAEGHTPVIEPDAIGVLSIYLGTGRGTRLPGAYEPDTNESQGGPIIDREFIEVSPWNTEEDPARAPFPYKATDWRARTLRQVMYDGEGTVGPTRLVAAMRCRVQSVLGDEVDVPTELL